jgi:hypothetical protein
MEKWTRDEIKEVLPDVQKVYRGKPDKCMCGCSGEYIYTSFNRAASGKNRGYVDDGKVIGVLRRFFHSDEPEENIDDHIFTKIVGKTQYTVYLMNEREN